MSNLRQIQCQKLGKEAAGLDFCPYPGALGERIYQHISAAGWDLWLSHQTMLINEYRLCVIEPQARSFLKEEMLKFLFGEGSQRPPDFVAEK